MVGFSKWQSEVEGHCLATPQIKQGKSHPTFMPGPPQENAHIWFSEKNRGWEQKGLRLIQFLSFSQHSSRGSSIPPHPKLCIMPWHHLLFHHLLRVNMRSVLKHICQSSSDPLQRLHKVKSLPALIFRVIFPLQQCDFLPKIHGRRCFILI